jgi:hypothetical protein
MGLYDGPLLVGYSQDPADPSTQPGEIHQLLSGVPTLVHSEANTNLYLKFLDGYYWSTDGKVYIVGSSYDTLNNYTHGVVWTWDGTSLAVEHTFPAALNKDNFAATCITEFNGALYLGMFNTPAGTPLGGRVFRKTTPAGAWAEVHNYLAASQGPVFLQESQGQLFVAYASVGIAVPSSFYSSPSGDPASWVGEPWIGVGPTPSPRHIFWDGIQWVYGEVDNFGFPPSLYTWTAPALGGPWAGPTIFFGATLIGKPYPGLAGDWFIVFTGSNVYKWSPVLQWQIYRTEAFSMQADILSAPSDGGVWAGNVYAPLRSPKTNGGGHNSYAKDLDAAVFLPDQDWSTPCSFVSTPVGPPTWDIVDIEPADWGAGPFCDETVVGDVVVHVGSHLEIDGSSGLADPSYYELEFGGACPALSADWDMQIEFTAMKLPKLQDFDGTRAVIWLHNTTTGRKVGFYFSEQGIAVLGLDTYATLLEGSQGYVQEGEQVLLKVTGLGSDIDNQRAYISVITAGGIFRRGFMSYNKVGAVDKLHIEATGSPERPSALDVYSIKVKTHSFVQGDSDSIDSTKPEALIV